MAATYFKKSWDGATKAGKVSGTEKKQLEENVTNNRVDWQQVINMTG